MLKIKKLIIFFIIICIPICSLANEIDEEIDFSWIEEEISKTSAELTSEIYLNSRYVVSIDRNSKEVLYSKNENVKTPMASTTKIMTA